MAEPSTAERIAQLESIVNELTSRIAGDPANTDLPPLLAAAQAELTNLQNPPGGAAPAAASTAAPAASTAVPAASTAAPAATTAAPAAAQPAASAAPAAPTPRPKIVAPAKPAAPAAASTGALAPAAGASKSAAPHLAIKPTPPTVSGALKTRPSPTVRPHPETLPPAARPTRN